MVHSTKSSRQSCMRLIGSVLLDWTLVGFGRPCLSLSITFQRNTTSLHERNRKETHRERAPITSSPPPTCSLIESHCLFCFLFFSFVGPFVLLLVLAFPQPRCPRLCVGPTNCSSSQKAFHHDAEKGQDAQLHLVGLVQDRIRRPCRHDGPTGQDQKGGPCRGH